MIAQQQQRFHIEDMQRDVQLIEAIGRLDDALQSKAQIDAARYEVASAQVPRKYPQPVPQAIEVPLPAPAAPELPIESPAAKPDGFDDERDAAKPLMDVIPDLKTLAVPPVSIESDDAQTIRIHRVDDGQAQGLYTIHARNADIRQFLVKLSEVSGVSILVSPEVVGPISLNLRNVRFHVALKAIVKSRNDVLEQDGEIIIVSTSNETSRLRQQNRKLRLRIYQPSYLSAVELERLIDPLLSPDGRHSVSTCGNHPSTAVPGRLGSGELPPRETVVVQDVDEVLGQIDQILIDMDVPPLQVAIEAKILSVRLAGKVQNGLDMQMLPCQQTCQCQNDADGLKLASLSCTVPTFIKSVADLASTSVVTSQRIQVLNKHSAELVIGDRIGTQCRPGQPVRFIESGTRLVVRPSISADGNIRLEIQPERTTSQRDRHSKVIQQNFAEVATHVLVHDRSTVVIGGLISEQTVQSGGRTSLMGTLPVVGAPFRHRHDHLQRTELLILLTPQILTDCIMETGVTEKIKVNDVQPAAYQSQRSSGKPFDFAKAHYDRARRLFREGNPVKARQQIDASLALNQQDRDAIQLRDEINQRLTQPSR
jgi:type IV pilus assembly protein PilQ